MATNTLQQIDVPEWVKWMHCTTIRCLTTDSGISPNHWGGFMLTVTYQCNQTPPLVRKMETPLQVETSQNFLYGCKAGLFKLKIMGAGTKTRHVFEARNIVFVEHHDTT